jgi:structure-specific recognition protein 1
MRLFVPNKIIQDDDEDAKVENGDGKSINGENKVRDAEALRAEINKITNSSNLGDAIAVLSEINMVYPRGKINISFLKNVFKISGPSHDYKIQYNHINRAFICPKQDGVSMAFVIGLTTPLRQGNTAYSFIVFQLKKNTDVELSLNLPENEDERKKIIKSPIEDNLKGDMYDLMAKLFKSIIGIGVIIPGKFKG